MSLFQNLFNDQKQFFDNPHSLSNQKYIPYRSIEIASTTRKGAQAVAGLSGLI